MRIVLYNPNSKTADILYISTAIYLLFNIFLSLNYIFCSNYSFLLVCYISWNRFQPDRRMLLQEWWWTFSKIWWSNPRSGTHHHICTDDSIWWRLQSGFAGQIIDRLCRCCLQSAKLYLVFDLLFTGNEIKKKIQKI